MASSLFPYSSSPLPKLCNTGNLHSRSFPHSYTFPAIKSSLDKKPPPSTKPTSSVGPDWLSNLTGSLTKPKNDDPNIPIAQPKPEDMSGVFNGALFLPLFEWMTVYGPIYRVAAGSSNFVVVSDPAIAKHVLKNYGKYPKGSVSVPSEFLFGSAFTIAEGPLWAARRRAVVPSLHKMFLSVIVDRVFCPCAERLLEKFRTHAINGTTVNIEENFLQLSFDVIGLALFNYKFDSLTAASPVIEALYTAYKEAELRTADIWPYWKIDVLRKVVPRQIKAERAVSLIRQTVEELVSKCKEIVETEGEIITAADYVNDSDPSILRFLVASREEVSSTQLRDDLISLLVAGHETTAAVLTWTVYLLSKDPSSLKKAQEEVDRVLQGRLPAYEDIKNLKFLTSCINESIRLYPHPPVLLRRAQVPDVLPGNYKVDAGQDVLISLYNVHHSPQVWERADEFLPERFDLEGPVPNESNTDFRYIPFGGGPRKCIGEQFATLETIVALAIVLQHLNFELIPDQNISLKSGVTIHTANGLYMKVRQRETTTQFAA